MMLAGIFPVLRVEIERNLSLVRLVVEEYDKCPMAVEERAGEGR